MFCPKCASQNLEGASFCRSCGANISLVPQALSGQLARANEEQGITQDAACAIPGRRRRRELTLDSAFKNIFIGIAFLIISIALSRSIGAGWWFWMLIPAFSLMGTGVAQYIRIRERQSYQLPTQIPTLPPPVVRSTEHLMSPPASVTEGTTRHLTSKTSEPR
ncbi:MAG TPA: zinc ribbon domain-containing protein [Pyrinomonadaceae bacterium]|nr:zinc ribbon domain-containing protein [Pyrinomonadaceae bacterium]